MGKYDALFDEEQAKPAVAPVGKYSALFEEPKAAPVSPAAPPATPAEKKEPSIFDSVYAGARKAASFGFGDEIEAAALRARDLVTGRSGRTAADLVTGRKGAKTYAEYRDEVRARDKAAEDAHPIAAGAGEVVGGTATALIPGMAPARAATAGQAALNAAKVGAVYGAGNSEADLTKGEIGKFAQDVGTSAALSGAVGGITAKAVRGAPERVDERMIAGISRGEAGGAAKDRLYKRVVQKAGDEGEDLIEALGDEKLRRAVAVRAKSNPDAVKTMVQRKIDSLTPKTDPFYEQIDKAAGGVSMADIAKRLTAKAKAFSADGHPVMAQVVDAARENLEKRYGGQVIPSRAARNIANEIGEVAFAGDPSLPAKFRGRAQQALYRDVVGVIEDAGHAAGVNVAELRQLNKQISTLIPVRDALADRADKAAAGRTSLLQNLTSASLVGGGYAAGGVEGAAAGVAADAARRAALPAVRLADYQLARLVKAARGGSTAAQIAQAAIEMGVGRAAANELASRLAGPGTGPVE